jgi:type VI secretion system secreted protein VgrG
MIKLTQENRQAVIETPLGPDTLMLQHFSGSEGLSKDFSYTMTVLSEDAAIDGNALVGKRISVTYNDENGRKRHFNGFVSRFEYNQHIEEPIKAAAYTIEMVPWLWFLRHNSDCQIFQEMSAPEIIKQIFNELGYNDVRNDLTENYPTREYCVQYNESDFNFVCRLMEEEGIFFYFEHTKDKHTLVMCDSPSGYFEIQETDVQYSPVGQSQFKQLTSWRHVYEFRPGKVTQKDFNFKKPTDGLSTNRTSKVKFEESSKLEMYQYPGLYDEESKGSRLTKVRLEELEAEHDHVVGAGSYLNFTPGGKFTVSKHIRPGEQGRSYALIEVHTEINSNLGFDDDAGDDFTNTFRCIPSETIFRSPRTTPKPFVEGPQTAIVSTDGQEIVIDEHGRVKVQFHWDRYGKRDVNSSCWIRVSQVHAGNGWGMIDIPRQNEEVIVSFLNGDPDRPIITGRVYNGDNPIPYGLKGAGDNTKNKTRRGNTTKSYESDGYNEMTMDDTAGSEQIRIHGQNNMDTTVQNDQTLTVNNNRTKTIAVDETNSIGNNRKTDVGVNHDEKVGNNQSVDVGSDQDISIGANQKVTIGKMKNEAVGMMSNEAVGMAKTTNVGGAYTVTVGAVMNTAVAGASVEEVGYLKKTMVAGSYSMSSGSTLSIEADTTLELKCGNSSITLDKSGLITIEGVTLNVKVAGNIKMDASLIDLN